MPTSRAASRWSTSSHLEEGPNVQQVKPLPVGVPCHILSSLVCGLVSWGWGVGVSGVCKGRFHLSLSVSGVSCSNRRSPPPLVDSCSRPMVEDLGAAWASGATAPLLPGDISTAYFSTSTFLARLTPRYSRPTVRSVSMMLLCRSSWKRSPSISNRGLKPWANSILSHSSFTCFRV